MLRETTDNGQPITKRAQTEVCALFHGGEGIRTPVRLQIPRYIYVRILLFQSHPISGQQTACHGPVALSYPRCHDAIDGQPDLNGAR